MESLTRILALVFSVLVLFVGFAFLFGPREPAAISIKDFDRIITGDPDAYLAQAEAAFDDVTNGAQKRIVWAGERRGSRTPLAIIYLHGFAATSEELRPVPDRVAAALGANLVFARLAGHGRGGEALAQVSMNDWLNDLAEAMAIGRKIGERVVIMGTDLGGTLAAFGAIDGKIKPGLAGIVLISPNFGLRAVGARFLDMPYARQLLPLLVGGTRITAPLSDAHAKWWTTSYPTVAVLPTAALVNIMQDLPFEAARIPALFIVDDADRVVSTDAARDIERRWGGPSDLVEFHLGPDDDPARHVLAGDILSPGQTDAMVARLVDWIGALENL